MPSSSDSIAQLAGALARAQLELVNPVKTHVAVLDTNGSGGKCYRYAPLSAGLDIVRKVLGKHEIAIIQTTDIEAESSTVVLTTTLAHASGEWISARWPVCTSADLSNPQLMGAGLTYARRYGLFTLAGLAGEDDLDAGGFLGPRASRDEAEQPRAHPTEAAASERGELPNHSHRGRHPTCDPVLTGLAGKGQKARRRQEVSKPQERKPSADCSPDDLLRNLERIEDTDTLLQWALEALPARNALEDSQRAILDAAFLARADAIGVDPDLLVAFRFDATPLAHEPAAMSG